MAPTRPEQSAWWAEAEKCFDGDVTFHDCDDVVTFLEGGSADSPRRSLSAAEAAREGESKEMAAEMRQMFEAEMVQMQDLTYLDLRHPWFASKA